MKVWFAWVCSMVADLVFCLSHTATFHVLSDVGRHDTPFSTVISKQSPVHSFARPNSSDPERPTGVLQVLLRLGQPAARPQTPTEQDCAEEDKVQCRAELRVAERDGGLGPIDQPLEDGAGVNAPPVGYYGNPTLQEARSFDQPAVTRMLVSAGVDVTALRGNNGD